MNERTFIPRDTVEFERAYIQARQKAIKTRVDRFSAHAQILATIIGRVSHGPTRDTAMKALDLLKRTHEEDVRDLTGEGE